MGAIAWVMMALAIWHFAIWVPDRFWGGIAGAFVGAFIGGMLSGLILSGFSVPGNDELSLADAFVSIPGAVLGMAIFYVEGVRREGVEGAVGPTGTR